MERYSIERIKAICEAARLPLGIPFIDSRLEEYRAKYNGGHVYYAVLRDLVRELRPEIVVEIGAWQGTSAACFAAGNPDTTVITIDHHSDPGDDVNQARTLEAAGEFANLLYIQGCSTEKVHQLKPGTVNVFPHVKEFLAEKRIDFLFIDGWHSDEMARADYETYAPLLAPNALVICDDLCGGDGAAISGMREFWDRLPGIKYLDGRIHPGYPMGFSIMQQKDHNELG